MWRRQGFEQHARIVYTHHEVLLTHDEQVTNQEQSITLFAPTVVSSQVDAVLSRKQGIQEGAYSLCWRCRYAEAIMQRTVLKHE